MSQLKPFWEFGIKIQQVFYEIQLTFVVFHLLCLFDNVRKSEGLNVLAECIINKLCLQNKSVIWKHSFVLVSAAF